VRAREWAKNGEVPLTTRLGGKRAGIVVAGWHAGAAEPIASPKVFTNVTTSATATAEAAAHYAIALAKSDAMADVIKQCKGCTLLETRVQSLGSATKDRPTVTASLLQKYDAK